MTIVCGTDFSTRADGAMRVAAALAKKREEPLLFVHAVDPLDVSRSTPEVETSAATARLAAAADSLRADGIAVDARILQGPADEALVAVAGEVGASLLVVSRLGRRSAHRWRVGSTAARIVQTSAVPVLLADDPAPFEAWARGERVLRITLAAAPEPSTEPAVRFLAGLCALGSCEIRVLHLYDPADSAARLGLRASPAHGGEPEIEAAILGELHRRTGALDAAGARYRVVANVGRTADAIALETDPEQTDLLVAGTRQRSGLSRLWHGSVTHGLLHAARVPLLCVPRPSSSSDVQPLPRFRRALVTTDFSELGDRAVRYAYGLVGPGGVVHLLHVLEERGLPSPLYAHYERASRPTEEMREREAHEATLRLQSLVPAQAEVDGIETRCEVVRGGNPAAAIRAAAERLDVDVICMATHGRSGLSETIAGSVARRVLARNPRPVVVVGPAPGSD